MNMVEQEMIHPRSGGWAARYRYLVLATVLVGSSQTSTAVVRKELTLDRGLRIVAVQVSQATSSSVFVFLPLGLATDGNKQAQWSHLIEHLLIRSGTALPYQRANAETLWDHMRLDYYCQDPLDWPNGLEHVAGWLRGVFTHELLDNERLRVLSETDRVAWRNAAAKFAFSAWGQGFWHNAIHAGLKADVLDANLTSLHRMWADHGLVPSQTLVFVVGSMSVDDVLAKAQTALGGVNCMGKPAKLLPHSGDRNMTWDLDARQIMLCWMIPGIDRKEYAAMMVVGNILTERLFNDEHLKTMVEYPQAGPRLHNGSEAVFFLTVSLKPEAHCDDVYRLLCRHIAVIGRPTGLYMAPSYGQELAASMTREFNDSQIKAQAMSSKTGPDSVERNLFIQWGMQEFRYSERQKDISEALKSLTLDNYAQLAQRYLCLEKCIIYTLRPQDEALAFSGRVLPSSGGSTCPNTEATTISHRGAAAGWSWQILAGFLPLAVFCAILGGMIGWFKGRQRVGL